MEQSEQSMVPDNPAEAVSTLSEMMRQYMRVVQLLGVTQMIGDDNAAVNAELPALFASAATRNMLDPATVATVNTNAFKQVADTARDQWMQFACSKSETSPEGVAGERDPRFRSEHWHENPWFSALRQSYLIGSEYFRGVMKAPEDMDAEQARKLNFFTEQVCDALAPSNFFWTNPDAIGKAGETNGVSIVQGLKNMADDLEFGSGLKMVDKSAFELGLNIATTPGQVIAKNRLVELIHYAAAGEKVHATPIMIIPPWINKYYILDLKPKNSFVAWLVEQGYSVFMISWINPDESYRETGIDDYLGSGALWALEQIKAATGASKVNAIGYCLGGTLLAMLLGYCKGVDIDPIRSATFLTTMINFSDPGDLGVFVNEKSVSRLEEKMDQVGYLDGNLMASTFSMLRANDLIWHFVINNYLMGEAPGAFDLLYWNSDSTRMPAKMHSEYLRWMYLENRLSKPGGLQVMGQNLDLSEVTVPCLFLSTQQDHIAPWKSTYAGARLMAGDVRFMLGESGHIAGVINPPAKNKYGYWTFDGELPETAEEWLEVAANIKGSWWPEWKKWLRKYHGKKVPAQSAEAGDSAKLPPAPGNYVRM